MNNQNVKPYITPTVMSVEFKVEVGAALSAQTSSFSTTSTSDWMLTTSSQSNNEAPQRSTSNFFEYDW